MLKAFRPLQRGRVINVSKIVLLGVIAGVSGGKASFGEPFVDPSQLKVDRTVNHFLNLYLHIAVLNSTLKGLSFTPPERIKLLPMPSPWREVKGEAAVDVVKLPRDSISFYERLAKKLPEKVRALLREAVEGVRVSLEGGLYGYSPSTKRSYLRGMWRMYEGQQPFCIGPVCVRLFTEREANAYTFTHSQPFVGETYAVRVWGKTIFYVEPQSLVVKLYDINGDGRTDVVVIESSGGFRALSEKGSTEGRGKVEKVEVLPGHKERLVRITTSTGEIKHLWVEGAGKDRH